MASSPSSQAARKVPAAAIVVLLILLCAYIGRQGYKSLSPPTMPNAAVQPVNPQYTWLQQMARKSQGDINNLGPEEREKVMKATRGYGPRVLQDQWASMKH